MADDAGTLTDAVLARIQRVMTERGISQSDLARTLERPPQTVGAWFRNRQLPKGELLLRLPQALGVPLAQLLGEEEWGRELFRAGYSTAIAEMKRTLDELEEKAAARAAVAASEALTRALTHSPGAERRQHDSPPPGGVERRAARG